MDVPPGIFLCAVRQCLGLGGRVDAMNGTVLLGCLMGEGGGAVRNDIVARTGSGTLFHGAARNHSPFLCAFPFAFAETP